MKAFLYVLGVFLATVSVNCLTNPADDLPLPWLDEKAPCPSDLKLPEGPKKYEYGVWCYYACHLRKIGHMIDDRIFAGKVDGYLQDNILNLDYTVTDKVYDCAKRANKHVAWPCQVAVSFYKCVTEKVHESSEYYK